MFVALSACIAVQLGNYPTWMFFQCFCAMTLFYCAHWQTYVSGIFNFNMKVKQCNEQNFLFNFIYLKHIFLIGSLRFGKVDVTEAQFTIIGIHLISAIFGPQVWMIEVVLFLIMLSVLYMARMFGVTTDRIHFISFFSFLHDYNLTNGKYCISLCFFLKA